MYMASTAMRLCFFDHIVADSAVLLSIFLKHPTFEGVIFMRKTDKKNYCNCSDNTGLGHFGWALLYEVIWSRQTYIFPKSFYYM